MSEQLNISYIKFLQQSGINSFLKNHPNNFYTLNVKKKSQIITYNIKNLEDIASLDELALFIKKSDICKLAEQSVNMIFSDGNPKAKIMLIGEAPGAEEDRLGKPFVGAAGQLLDKMLAAIKLDRKSVYITNVIPWRPPKNRTPSTEEVLQCLPFIQRHIEIIEPKIIVLLGGTAAKAILATLLGIMKLRGKWHEYKSLKMKKSIPTLATFHPAFLLRSPSYKKQSWNDLQMLQKKIQNENL